MASPETLVPDGDDSGWPTGAFGDIDEAIGSPDAAVMSTTDAELPDVLILDIAPSEVVDGDTVTNITINCRARVTGTGGKDDLTFDLLIGGVAQGTAVTHASVGSTYSTLVSNDTGWNVDRSETDMDGMQVRVTSGQRGMGSAATYEIDALEVVTTYTAGSAITPITGLALSVFTPVGDLGGSIGSITGLITNLFTPTSGLKGIGVLDVLATGVFTPTSNLTQAPAAITGLATSAFTPVSGLKGIGVLTGNTTGVFTPTSGVKGIGVLTVVSNIAFAATSTLTEAFDPGEPITGSVSIVFSPSSSLRGIGVLDVTSSAVFTPTSNLTGIGVLTGVISAVFTPLSDLTGIGVLDVSAVVTFSPTSVLTGITGATLDQEGFRFRNDDGTEITATWAATQEVDISEAIGVRKRLRILINGDGDVSSQQFRLEVKKNTDPDSAYKVVI